jgi:hypothetical protein
MSEHEILLKEHGILLKFDAQLEEDRDRLADAIHPGWSDEDHTTRPPIDKLVDKANFGRGLSEHVRRP